MCGHFTQELTWRQVHDLYSLTGPSLPLNPQPCCNGAPTQRDLPPRIRLALPRIGALPGDGRRDGDASHQRLGGDSLESFTIITTAASPGLANIHHRQPAIIDPDRVAPDRLSSVRLPGFLPHPRGFQRGCAHECQPIVGHTLSIPMGEHAPSPYVPSHDNARHPLRTAPGRAPAPDPGKNKDQERDGPFYGDQVLGP